MNAKQRQLRLHDYFEHMLEASCLCAAVSRWNQQSRILCQPNDPAGRADEHRHHW